jgi:hypothetical protein
LHTKVLAGGMSGAVGSALANPTDLIKIRMQTYPPAYSSTWQALRAIMFHEGLRGLYKGVTPSMIRAIILTASQLPTYDHTKYYLLGAGWLEEGYLLHTVSSMIAGLIICLH